MRLAVEEIGFDGFRYDMVKGSAAGWFARFRTARVARGILQYSAADNVRVGECWDSERTIDELARRKANALSDNP